MGVGSGGDDGMTIDDDDEEEIAAAAVDEMAAAALVGGIGLVTNSRIGTPTNFVDGIVVVNLEEVGVALVPPLPPPTQQSTNVSLWQIPHQQLL
jgi:hypothetical protein